MNTRPIVTETAITQDAPNGKAYAIIFQDGKEVEMTEHEFRARADVYLMEQGFQYERGGFDQATTYYYK